MKQAGERGVALVALVASLTIALIVLMTILPTWSYVAKNEREKELLFRGSQIADAIQMFQKKYGGPPPSLEALVKQRCLRKVFKDPMSKKGEWRIIREGEPIIPFCGGSEGMQPRPQPRPQPLPGPRGAMGPIAGVVSLSKEKSLRKLNNCTSYDQWFFLAAQPRDWAFFGGDPARILIQQQGHVPQRPPRPPRP